jgi:hypothetical protein
VCSSDLSDPHQHNHHSGSEEVHPHAMPVSVVALGFLLEFGGPAGKIAARGQRLHRSSRSGRNES